MGVNKTTPPAPPPLSPDHPLLVKLHQALPASLLLHALRATDTNNRRTARLPAAALLLLLVLAGLFRSLSLSSLLRFVGLARPKQGREDLASGTLTAARKRLGSAPFRHLLKATASAAVPAVASCLFCGLRLFALDGSKLRVADTPANRAHFGGHRGGHGESAYPLMRLMLLLDVASRKVVDARVGAFAVAEQTLGLPLLDALPPRSLLLLDKGFFSMVWLINLQRKGQERHVLLPVRKGASYRVVRRLGPGDDLVTFTVSAKAKKHLKDPPATFQLRVLTVHLRGWRPRRLATTMLDPQTYPRKAIGQGYLQRWEVELALQEIKTTQLQREEALRSRLPELCEQEVLAVLVGYNAVRQQMTERAQRLEVAPNRLSFRGELECVRWQWIVQLMADPGVQQRLAEGDFGLVLPARREGRRCERVVKLGRSKFPPKSPRSSPAERYACTVGEAYPKAA
jgi:hypothetical protein